MDISCIILDLDIYSNLNEASKQAILVMDLVTNVERKPKVVAA
jgi:hypothetical protein